MSDEKRLEKIENDLVEIKNILKVLTEEIKNTRKICSRMDGHIDFVENTYDGLKMPLEYVKNKVEGVMWYGKQLE